MQICSASSIHNASRKKKAFWQISWHDWTGNRSLRKGTALVFASPDWHEGVVGIVAARLTRLYFKPAILISVKKDLGKGSARSIPGIDIRSALTACESMLQGFGGHAMAAGLQIQADQIAAFGDRLHQIIGQAASPEDFFPKTIIDFGTGAIGYYTQTA